VKIWSNALALESRCFVRLKEDEVFRT